MSASVSTTCVRFSPAFFSSSSLSMNSEAELESSKPMVSRASGSAMALSAEAAMLNLSSGFSTSDRAEVHWFMASSATSPSLSDSHTVSSGRAFSPNHPSASTAFMRTSVFVDDSARDAAATTPLKSSSSNALSIAIAIALSSPVRWENSSSADIFGLRRALAPFCASVFPLEDDVPVFAFACFFLLGCFFVSCV